MIKGVSEFKEFLFSKSAGLGLLGGTPGARAALRAAATANAKAKVKSASTVRRRDVYLSAFSSVLGGAPRRRSSASSVAEEAFGPFPASAAPGVAPAAAYPGLEEALAGVIDADATVFQADLSGDGVADEDNFSMQLVPGGPSWFVFDFSKERSQVLLSFCWRCFLFD